MGLFGSSDSGDTGFASKLRTSTGSKDLDLSYGNDSLGGQGFNDSAGDMNAQEFANTLQMQGQMAQLFSKFHEVNDTCWDICIGDSSLGESLSGRNQTCISNCAERFVDSSLFLANRFAQLAQKHQ